MKPWVKITCQIFWILCFIGLICQMSLAEDRNANDFLTRGLALVKTGKHEKAIDLFKQALEINPNFEDAYLHLGIAYRKTESYDLALMAFQNLLERNPKNGPALFFKGLSLQDLERYQESIVYLEKAGNLDADLYQAALFSIGRAHFELGNNEEAKAKFNKTIKADSNTETAKGAKTLLKILADKKPDKPWSLSAGTGVMYDDNITVIEQDLSSNQEDIIYNFDFSGSYKVIDTKKNTWEAGYSFFQNIHEDLSNFDIQSHAFSLNGSHKFKNLKSGMRSYYSRSKLGDDDFLEIYSISPNVEFSLKPNFYTIVNYTFKYNNYFNIPSRDGLSHGLGFDNFYFFMENKGYFLLGYQAKHVNTRGAEFDYLGNFVTAKVKYPLQVLGLETQLDLSYKFFIKDYNNVTPSIGEERRDIRHTIQFGIIQPINKNVKAKLQYKYINADSNLPTFDFSKNIVAMNLEVSF